MMQQQNTTLERIQGRKPGDEKKDRKTRRSTKKETIYEKNYWKINASHDGYQKKYNTIHERNIEFFPGEETFVGSDKILKKINKN